MMAYGIGSRPSQPLSAIIAEREVGRNKKQELRGQ